MLLAGGFVAWQFWRNPREKIPVSQPDQTALTPQEKCEQSGGEWIQACPECPGCECKYICDCTIFQENSIDYINEIKVTTYERQYRLEKEGVCEKCTGQQDCYVLEEPSCKVESTKVCEELSITCEDEICKTKRQFFAPKNDEQTYECVKGECVPLEELCPNFVLDEAHEIQDQEKIPQGSWGAMHSPNDNSQLEKIIIDPDNPQIMDEPWMYAYYSPSEEIFWIAQMGGFEVKWYGPFPGKPCLQ